MSVTGSAVVNAAIFGGNGGRAGFANIVVVAGRVTAGTGTSILAGCLARAEIILMFDLAGAETIRILDGTGRTVDVSVFAEVLATDKCALPGTDATTRGCSPVANFGGGDGSIVLSFGFNVGVVLVFIADLTIV